MNTLHLYRAGKELPCFRWRFKAKNGRILAHSESYAREADCRAAVDVVRCEARKAQVTPPHRLTGLT